MIDEYYRRFTHGCGFFPCRILPCPPFQREGRNCTGAMIRKPSQPIEERYQNVVVIPCAKFSAARTVDLPFYRPPPAAERSSGQQTPGIGETRMARSQMGGGIARKSGSAQPLTGTTPAKTAGQRSIHGYCANASAYTRNRAVLSGSAAGVSGPAEILWLPGCAHVPHQQAREAVLAAAARFIERVCANMCP